MLSKTVPITAYEYFRNGEGDTIINNAIWGLVEEQDSEGSIDVEQVKVEMPVTDS